MFLGTLVANLRLREAVGQEAVTVVALAFAAAWVATAESRAMTARVRRAFLSIGLSMENAARLVRMDLAHLSRQLNDVEQLSLSRLAEIGPDFNRAFALELLKDAGGYTAVPDGHLLRLLERVEDMAGQPRRVA